MFNHVCECVQIHKMCSVSMKMVIKSVLWRHVYSCGSTCPKINSVDKKIIIQNSHSHNYNVTMENDNSCGDSANFDYFSWLQNKAPGFLINSSQVKIIHEPEIFYSTLLAKIKNVQKRIILASLYIGTGELEKGLVNAIEESLKASKGKVKVNILLDYMRGTRGQNNSVKMLEPLLNHEFASNCTISLYHTPKLRGLMKLIIPKRFNELIGLQHMKIYIFDDSVIISGANLSNDYFVNRQDRYFLIEDCKKLTDFYHNLIELIAKFSFQVKPNSSLNPPTSLIKNPSSTHEDSSKSAETINQSNFIKLAQQEIKSFYTSAIEKSIEQQKRNINELNTNKIKDLDTWIFPLIQMGQLGIFYDCEITKRLLRSMAEGSVLKLATGYFNLTTEYSNALLRDCRAASCSLLTAHPMTNGFYGAKGVAGQIPAAYRIIEKSFFDSCQRLGLEDRIGLREYTRPGWTYHAKGLWYTSPNERKPCFTLIGSSNFGYRSVNRDLETQIALVTKNPKLQDALQQEYDCLQKYSHVVTKETFLQNEKKTPGWVYAAVFLFRYFF